MWLIIDTRKIVDLVGVGCEDVYYCPIDPSIELSSLFYLGVCINRQQRSPNITFLIVLSIQIPTAPFSA